MRPTKKLFWPTLAATSAVVLAIGARCLAQSASSLTVTTADLTSAGFTGITVQASQGTSYQAPNYYFRTKETVVSAHPEWGQTSNLVAVLLLPATWALNDSGTQTLDISGRTQVRLSRPGYYIVVTGPDKDKVTALGQLLKNK